MNTKPQILLVSGGEETGLKRILRRRASLAEAGSLPGMVRELGKRDFDVIVCEQDFPEGTWREALEELQARRVATPALVVSQTSTPAEGIEEWTEVLNAGAFDLLLAPSQEYSVLTMIEHAVASGQARALRQAS